jgi:hypothetical protein
LPELELAPDPFPEAVPEVDEDELLLSPPVKPPPLL